jgi:hypothetical protein
MTRSQPRHPSTPVKQNSTTTPQPGADGEFHPSDSPAVPPSSRQATTDGAPSPNRKSRRVSHVSRSSDRQTPADEMKQSTDDENCSLSELTDDQRNQERIRVLAAALANNARRKTQRSEAP